MTTSRIIVDPPSTFKLDINGWRHTITNVTSKQAADVARVLSDGYLAATANDTYLGHKITITRE